ncbi:hypothetical protein [Paracidovorax cattleyae]|uniref:Uncharacterized protein n=1 Tax=Paracidovorax cattleyae TaxID=80868 RepID=A0A1H0KP95_9BURK|nr:hypothetical protein [Paracidovorax cattleyae]AVS73424.1 hypothetical protein C8240_04615 [Paracidovorax cattleyae]MBF9266749.1 hypothetical protein [Paracidovorax cattleyae]SDO57626.1 hypothetical protein SAMN04489708_101301 [Paracidovorax cattleyae]
MTIAPLACRREDGGTPIQITDAGTMSHLLFKLRHLIHFTTQAGAAGIARTGMIRASSYGLDGIFGAGVYMARIGRPLNGFIDKVSRIPIHLPTPAGTVRIVPYLVYVRWGTAGVKIAP